MKKLIFPILFILSGCGGAGDDTTSNTFVDNRVCVDNNNQETITPEQDADNDESDSDLSDDVANEAVGQGFVIQRTAKGTAICGTQFDIDAVIANGEPKDLSNFFAENAK